MSSKGWREQQWVRKGVNKWMSEWVRSVRGLSMVITGAPNLSNEAEASAKEKWGLGVEDGDCDVWRMRMCSNDWGEWGQSAGESVGEGISKSQHEKLHVFTYSSILLKKCAAHGNERFCCWLTLPARCRKVQNYHRRKTHGGRWPLARPKAPSRLVTQCRDRHTK